MTAAAEFNAWMDPTAADQVLTSGVSVKMIPLDLTELFGWNPRLVRCETKGEFTTGETVVDRRPWGSSGHVLVAEDVDVPEVSARILSAVASIA